MNVMKSRLMMAAYMAMAYNMSFEHLNFRGSRNGSPAWAPKRKKLKGWQKK